MIIAPDKRSSMCLDKSNSDNPDKCSYMCLGRNNNDGDTFNFNEFNLKNNNAKLILE